jgi:hypothetical protein
LNLVLVFVGVVVGVLVCMWECDLDDYDGFGCDGSCYWSGNLWVSGILNDPGMRLFWDL